MADGIVFESSEDVDIEGLGACPTNDTQALADLAKLLSVQCHDTRGEPPWNPLWRKFIPRGSKRKNVPCRPNHQSMNAIAVASAMGSDIEANESFGLIGASLDNCDDYGSSRYRTIASCDPSGIRPSGSPTETIGASADTPEMELDGLGFRSEPCLTLYEKFRNMNAFGPKVCGKLGARV